MISISFFLETKNKTSKHYKRYKNRYCTPMIGMRSKTLKDAKKECISEKRCDMFVDVVDHDAFYYCSKPNIKIIKMDSGWYESLYIKGIIVNLYYWIIVSLILLSISYDQIEIIFLLFQSKIEEISRALDSDCLHPDPTISWERVKFVVMMSLMLEQAALKV